MTDFDLLVRLTAEALNLSPAQLRVGLERSSFVRMGGSSLQAVQLSAAAARLATNLPSHKILGREPIGAVLRAATPLPELPTRPETEDRRALQEPLPGQAGILQTDEITGGTAYHLLFTAEVEGATAEALSSALVRLTERHESLRTMFVVAPDTGGYGRRVLPHARPTIRHQMLRPPAGRDAVDIVHAQLGRASRYLLRPFERPPVCFTVTTAVTPDGHSRLLVSMLVHHVLVDAWSIRVIFDELAALLAGAPLEVAPSPEVLAASHRQRCASQDWSAKLRTRAEQLRDVTTVLELPSDVGRPAHWDVAGNRLPGTLRPAASRAWRRIAEATGVTTTSVLLAAYALVLGRRCGITEMLIGIAAMRRDDPRTLGVVAPCAQVVPVRCRLDDMATTTEYLMAVADALAEAVDAADLPFDRIINEANAVRDRRRNPLVQFVLGVHDDLLPDSIRRGGVVLRLHEGHCGGAPFDATLYVQRGGDPPRLMLEYATAVITGDEAADLLDAVDATLVELADRLTEPLGEVRTISAAQQARLDAVRNGPALPPELPEADLWSMVLAAGQANPAGPAVRDNDGELSYAELIPLVGAQAEALSLAGIGDGDPVLLALPRGAAEIVAILGVLAIGAHYVAIDQSTPDERLRTLLGVLTPAAILVTTDPESSAFAERAVAACPHPVPRLDVVDVRSAPIAASLPELPAPRGDRPIYVAFTSGSTGVPKAVRVPHRAVARLVWPGPDCVVQCGPHTRMLRLSPLAFDASTLEVFAPLVAGGCVEVYPPGLVTPMEIAEFLLNRQVNVAWLTSGLFRLVADFAPHAFAQVDHVLAGGDVVAPQQVNALLDCYPGLRFTNGYGPTENTTFSTVAHFDDLSEVTDPLPIGAAVAGSGLLVLDSAERPVPPGGIGELYVTGLGLALDYAGNPRQTAAAFRAAPDNGERAYRTGDLVRLTRFGQLRFLGRTDHQVKVRGFRVELDEVRRVLVEQPGIKDSVVIVVGADASTRRLVAGIVPQTSYHIDVADIAGRLGRLLPGYAVPALWALLDEIPVTTNGKVDAAALEAVASPLSAVGGELPSADAPSDSPATATPEYQKMWISGPTTGMELAESAWVEALGSSPEPGGDFFQDGGDSVRLARMLGWLRKEHRIVVSPREFYLRPTARRLAELIQAELAETGNVTQ